MGLFITAKAVRWSVNQLNLLPKNQTALLFFLIFAVCPEVGSSNSKSRQEFETEFHRYFGGPIRGDGIAVYDPCGGQWRAENYIHSTVYGRLLVGSHRGTEGTEAFFQREPKAGGWPAQFELTDKGFDNLKYRNESPSLRYEYRLPLTAIATYYYRFDDISHYHLVDQRGLVQLYKQKILSKHSRLGELFVEGSWFLDTIFSAQSLTEKEKISCFPPSPFMGEPQQRVLLYADDIDYIKGQLKDGETIAEYVHNSIREGR